MPSSTTASGQSLGDVPCVLGSVAGPGRERSLIDACIDPLLVLSPDGHIVDANKAAAWVTGLSREELMGRAFSDHVVESQQFLCLLHEVLSAGTVTSRPLGFRHRTGQVTDMVCNASVCRDAHGEVTEVFLSARDITGQNLAEEALRRSERKFNEAQRVAHIGYWDRDVDADRAVWSDETYRIYGLRPQAQGVTWHDMATLIHPDDRARAMYSIQRALQGGLRYDIEFRVVRPDGEERIIHSQADVTRDSEGRAVRMFGTAQDVTEQKRAEEKLRNSELRYRALYRDNPVMLFTLDSRGVVLAVNPTGVSQLGYAQEELEGQSVLKVFHPDDREDVARQLQVCLRHPDQLQHWQYRKVRKDGGVLWVDELAQPVRDLNGELNVLVVCQDITERKRAEEEIRILNTTLEQRVQDRTRALAESEKRFHNIYDTSPVSIWQEDWTEVISSLDALRAEGVTDFAAYFREHPEFVGHALEAVKILDVNQWTVDLFAAKTKAQLLASLGTIFATPDTLPGFVGELVALAEGKQTYRTEMSLNTVAGDTVRCFLAMSFPPPGTGSGDVLVSVLDITERKRSEQSVRDLNEQLAGRARALEVANKELESFSYSVSHDLRAPLRTLDGFSRALLEDYADRLDEEGKDYLQRIRKASQRMGHLIDDMLHLAQVSRSELRRAPVDLSAIAQAVADGLRAAEPERKIEFVIEPGLSASGDARLLQIVVENLFGNACKFSRPRDTARIEFGRTVREGVPAYCVRDNGVGFDMTYANKLFGAFQRLHTTAEFPGTGIGLATVQRIIHRHGGTVAAESRPGEGAAFYFTLSDSIPPTP